MNKALLSSKTPEWSTPQWLFNALDALYRFNLDPAATAENAKCKQYFTKAENGLEQDWSGHSVFCNPPYGREIGKWVEKAFLEAQKPATKVVCLLPARTDTAWFHDYCSKGKVTFLRGRLKFGDGEGNAPFPSMFVVFGDV